MKINKYQKKQLTAFVFNALLIGFFMVAPRVYAGGMFTNNLSEGCLQNGLCTQCDVAKVINNVASGVFVVIGAIAVLFLFIAGIQYMVSLGNEERVGKAKAAVSGAILGLVVSFSAWLIINLVLRLLVGGDTLGFQNAQPWYEIPCHD
ncbi:MAG: pilin [bacterium]